MEMHLYIAMVMQLFHMQLLDPLPTAVRVQYTQYIDSIYIYTSIYSTSIYTSGASVPVVKEGHTCPIIVCTCL